MTITLAKVAAARKSSSPRRAARMARLIRQFYLPRGGRRDGDLPRRRRAGDCGAGLWHQDDPPCAENFWPGNAYVSMAKRLLVGRVAIDLLAGPSDLLVLADEPRIRSSPPPTCSRRPSTVPVTNASGS